MSFRGSCKDLELEELQSSTGILVEGYPKASPFSSCACTYRALMMSQIICCH